jgi:hypothetical protein
MLEGIDYIPLLHAKRAEIRALSKLEKAPRARMLPIIVFRPGDHHDLDNTWPIIASAVGPYRYGLDLDRHKYGTTANQPAATQFDALFQSDAGYLAYYERVASMDGAIPVFRSSAGIFFDLDKQFDQIEKLDRGIILRIERNYTQNWIDVIQHDRFNQYDAIVLVDLGWSPDVISLEMWSSQVIEKITDNLPDIEIVALSSSFPNSFSHIDDKGVFSIDDRDVYSRLVRRHNSATIKYGDWGSTRESSDQGGGKPWPRIDVASTGDWTCFRQTESESGYQPVAARAVTDELWKTVPASWGKNTIQCTQMGIPGRITGTEIATSVRVNIHLTVQALGGAPVPVEEIPYVDDF